MPPEARQSTRIINLNIPFSAAVATMANSAFVIGSSVTDMSNVKTDQMKTPWCVMSAPSWVGGQIDLKIRH